MENWSEWRSGPQGIISEWRLKRNPTDDYVQTNPITFEETSCQTDTSAEIETQTDEVAEKPQEFVEMKSPYPPSLYAFFAKVTQPMCEALEENVNPLYNLAINIALTQREDEDKRLEEAQAKLNATRLHQLIGTAVSDDIHASCVGWNCTGSHVAIGYSLPQHTGWCSHLVPLSVWSLNRLNNQLQFAIGVKSGIAPHKEIILPSCITSLDFHPTNPDILAVGLFSGEVVLVDLHASSSSEDLNEEKNDQFFTKNTESIDTTSSEEIFHVGDTSLHASCVESTKWLTMTSKSDLSVLAVKNASPQQQMILTCSRDGFVGLWSVNKTFNRVYLEKRFAILPRSLPDRIGNKLNMSAEMKEIGFTALSSSKVDPKTFILGTYGGFLFQADLTAVDELDAISELDSLALSQESSPLSSGGAIYLGRMKSYVKGVDCSPFHQNLYLVLSTHGHVELQNSLKPDDPTLQLCMMEDAGADIKWSGRPMSFGVAWNKTLSVFNLTKSDAEPCFNLEHEDPLCAIAFNKTEVGIVATTDTQGYLHIWKLPEWFKETSGHAQEIDALIALGKIGE